MTLQWFAFCVFSVLLRNASAREHQQHLRSQGPFWDKIVSGVKKAANTVKDAIKGPPPQPPGRAERAEDFFNCDRQCQWFVQEKVPKHKFIDTRVIGKRVAKAGRSFDSKGRFCACWFNNKKKDGTFKNLTPTEEHWIKRTSSKHFDTVRTWSGDKPEDYSSPYVCVAENSGKDTEKRYTMTVEQLESEEGKKRLENKEITPHHCGRCSACSSRKDIEVLAKTREWITEVMTDVSTDYAKPKLLGGHGDIKKLKKELTEKGIDFSLKPARPNQASCMDVWADNIACDAVNCKSKCWIKFFDSSNAKTAIDNDSVGTFDFHAKCLKCDEEFCGPAFIKGAGANRRSSGIDSDIERADWQKCKWGLYSQGKPWRPTTMPSNKKGTLEPKPSTGGSNEKEELLKESEEKHKAKINKVGMKHYQYMLKHVKKKKAEQAEAEKKNAEEDS